MKWDFIAMVIVILLVTLFAAVFTILYVSVKGSELVPPKIIEYKTYFARYSAVQRFPK